jgi:hypothetical protein
MAAPAVRAVTAFSVMLLTRWSIILKLNLWSVSLALEQQTFGRFCLANQHSRLTGRMLGHVLAFLLIVCTRSLVPQSGSDGRPGDSFSGDGIR